MRTTSEGLWAGGKPLTTLRPSVLCYARRPQPYQSESGSKANSSYEGNDGVRVGMLTYCVGSDSRQRTGRTSGPTPAGILHAVKSNDAYQGTAMCGQTVAVVWPSVVFPVQDWQSACPACRWAVDGEAN